MPRARAHFPQLISLSCSYSRQVRDTCLWHCLGIVTKAIPPLCPLSITLPLSSTRCGSSHQYSCCRRSTLHKPPNSTGQCLGTTITKLLGLKKLDKLYAKPCDSPHIGLTSTSILHRLAIFWMVGRDAGTDTLPVQEMLTHPSVHLGADLACSHHDTPFVAQHRFANVHHPLKCSSVKWLPCNARSYCRIIQSPSSACLSLRLDPYGLLWLLWTPMIAQAKYPAKRCMHIQ